MFYLTITAKVKNARRHIVKKGNNIDELRKLGNNMNIHYITEIYDGTWQLVETVNKKGE